MKKYFLLAIAILLMVFSDVKFANAQCCVSAQDRKNCVATNSCTGATFPSAGLTCDQLHLANPNTCVNISTSLPTPPVSPAPTPAPTSTTASSGPYQLLEGIPGFFNAGDSVSFPTYIIAIYKFGLWAIGLCAMIMIMIGGYMYLTSAGNTASTGKAKEVITDAIIGLILALTSYLLLYIINPNLVQMTF